MCTHNIVQWRIWHCSLTRYVRTLGSFRIDKITKFTCISGSEISQRKVAFKIKMTKLVHDNDEMCVCMWVCEPAVTIRVLREQDNLDACRCEYTDVWIPIIPEYMIQRRESPTLHHEALQVTAPDISKKGSESGRVLGDDSTPKGPRISDKLTLTARRLVL